MSIARIRSSPFKIFILAQIAARRRLSFGGADAVSSIWEKGVILSGERRDRIDERAGPRGRLKTPYTRYGMIARRRFVEGGLTGGGAATPTPGRGGGGG